MKKTIKLFGIIAIVAVIGFGIAACGGDDGTDPNSNSNNNNNNNNTPDIASFSGTWNASDNRSIVFSGSTFNYKVKRNNF